MREWASGSHAFCRPLVGGTAGGDRGRGRQGCGGEWKGGLDGNPGGGQMISASQHLKRRNQEISQPLPSLDLCDKVLHSE